MIIGILFGALFLLIFGGGAYYQYSNKKKTIDHVCCTFVTSVGNSYDVLLPYKGNWVEPPQTAVTGLHGKKKKIPRYLLPDNIKKVPTVQWPLAGLPRILCSEVKRVFYTEGNPKPWPIDEIDTFDAAKYLELAYEARQAAETVQELKDKEDQTAGRGLNTTYLWIALGGIALISIIGAVLTYLSYSQPATYW